MNVNSCALSVASSCECRSCSVAYGDRLNKQGLHWSYSNKGNHGRETVEAAELGFQVVTDFEGRLSSSLTICRYSQLQRGVVYQCMATTTRDGLVKVEQFLRLVVYPSVIMVRVT